MSDQGSKFTEGLDVRREVLGEDYVSSALASSDEADGTFQRFVVENCWSTAWTDLRLSRRERSLLTLGITAAMGRFDEFELHVRGAYNNGVTREELEALAIHIGVYAGIPTALGARRALKRATGSGEEPDTEASASGLPS